ncbi:hypothetical protein A3F27_00525 [Candidatus Kaiserbacteria bacterium RIFCSPHIGHO2_12_FULL_53_13]|uniref:Uncharacterized protein n=1 Tax=Candidatus Kaiserbacteria bacterium RIFCSPHIGHO2_12_FULL_53_13 TaxID=1798502 RepID=A0A1F6E7R8_9BACT|nr:MAG: hypothetical protein A3F27_00525 [Candidatus Kaiserbacteria bacterium RIFCSPHIGHO2_12_FULL_53_13]OGG74445.1 MAG: hypothetical protein A3A37_02230 [Candidatus Kaiserbacteria bacterium RIFCSPLOWO2_01_FULL_52_36]
MGIDKQDKPAQRGKVIEMLTTQRFTSLGSGERLKSHWIDINQPIEIRVDGHEKPSKLTFRCEEDRTSETRKGVLKADVEILHDDGRVNKYIEEVSRTNQISLELPRGQVLNILITSVERDGDVIDRVNVQFGSLPSLPKISLETVPITGTM